MSQPFFICCMSTMSLYMLYIKSLDRNQTEETLDEDMQSSILLSSKVSIFLTNRSSKVAVEDNLDNTEDVYILMYFISLNVI